MQLFLSSDWARLANMFSSNSVRYWRSVTSPLVPHPGTQVSFGKEVSYIYIYSVTFKRGGSFTTFVLLNTCFVRCFSLALVHAVLVYSCDSSLSTESRCPWRAGGSSPGQPCVNTLTHYNLCFSQCQPDLIQTVFGGSQTWGWHPLAELLSSLIPLDASSCSKYLYKTSSASPRPGLTTLLHILVSGHISGPEPWCQR